MWKQLWIEAESFIMLFQCLQNQKNKKKKKNPYMNVKIKADFTTQKCHWLWFLHTYAAWNIMFIFFPTFFFSIEV